MYYDNGGYYDGGYPQSRTVQDDYYNVANGFETRIERFMQELVRPHRYRHQRPSFYSAYAKAAHRYEFDCGRVRNMKFLLSPYTMVRHPIYFSTAKTLPNHWTDSEYVVPVTVGTPGVTVHLDFDTGSSDLWIWSSELAGASRYRTHQIYDPYASSTAQHAHGLTWNITYGDGSSANGDVYLDNVTVAGVTIPCQAVECARELSSAFLKDGGNDGLLGLAWPDVNTVQPQRVKTPMENMMEQGLIPEALFTVKLGHGKEPSFYSFGTRYIDSNVTSNQMYWTPVDNINGDTHRRPQDNHAILDTGTTLLLVDDHVLERIYSAVPGAVYDEQGGGWKYPTDTQIPEVWFAVGEQMFVIHPADFGFGHDGDGYTFGGIQSRGDSSYDIFGDVFLKNVYAVFHQGQQMVGLAQRDD
ncbi:hypothetical protein EIP86_000392 [Pleurotus ostreatoroseus]|nr:hypothetical protein EIP86_000392 [Pleurotus ostreatoroseus]